jgi:hypothetical protein
MKPILLERRTQGVESLETCKVGDLPLTFDSVDVKNFFILFFFLFKDLEGCR